MTSEGMGAALREELPLREMYDAGCAAVSEVWEQLGIDADVTRAFVEVIIDEALAAVPEAPEPVYEWMVRRSRDGVFRANRYFSDLAEARSVARTARTRGWSIHIERRTAPGPWERVEEGTER